MKNYLLFFTLFLLIGISISYSVTASEHDEHRRDTRSSMILDQEKNGLLTKVYIKGWLKFML